MGVERQNEPLVDLARQDHAHHAHDLGRRHAQAVLELDGQTQFLHEGGDVLAAAVHDDGTGAHELHEHDVFHHRRAQGLVDHGRAAVLDDDRLACQGLHPRKRLRENERVLLGHLKARALRLCLRV